MKEFKFGEKVRVRNDLIAGRTYGDELFTQQMVKFKGKIFTILKILKNKNKDSIYAISEDETGWRWTEEMVEKVKEIEEPKHPKYLVVTNDKILHSTNDLKEIKEDCRIYTLTPYCKITKEEVIKKKYYEQKTCDCGNYFKNEHEEEIGFCGDCR